MAKNIVQTEGFTALYKGCLVSFIGVAHVVIYFPLYEWLKEFATRHGTPSSFEIFLFSTFSKTIASSITYPHTLIRSRIMDSRKSPDKLNIRSILRKTLKKEGITALWSGFKIDLARVLPFNAIIFVVFERCKHYLLESRFVDFSLTGNKRTFG
eukprot:TRINITY_DN3811_c0_g1_i1.p1 TRINITY_DN3811_c0_g1~~TRINITY_DN3811_c0_g1_i1.p1  ORF type:complete len:154 (+),score=10.87 TRINITY_DN3811_c0_g1_i1:349-810(+)